MITPRARQEAKQSSWKEKTVANVSNICSTYAYLQRLVLKVSQSYTFTRMIYNKSTTDYIIQFKVTERITLLLCLYLLFLRLNSSHGQWREFKPIRFPLSWSSNERRKGLTNGKYCNRLGRRSRLRHAQMTLFTKVTLRIKPGNTVTQWKLTCNVFLVVGKKDRFKKNYDRNLLRYT